jgi:hypothetical protein
LGSQCEKHAAGNSSSGALYARSLANPAVMRGAIPWIERNLAGECSEMRILLLQQ